MALELKQLRSMRSLNAALKEARSEVIEEIIEKLETILQERREEEKRNQEDEASRRANVQDMRNFMAERNITIHDLMEEFHCGPKKRGPMKPKYRYVDLEGIERTWTGQGMTPVQFSALMEATHTTKEDYRLTPEEQQRLFEEEQKNRQSRQD